MIAHVVNADESDVIRIAAIGFARLFKAELIFPAMAVSSLAFQIEIFARPWTNAMHVTTKQDLTL